METKKIVEQINTLLNSLKDDVYVSIVDENGNDANLVLFALECDNGQITGWCQTRE
jgi:hypothetical protein